jgi:hypothetical protein
MMNIDPSLLVAGGVSLLLAVLALKRWGTMPTVGRIWGYTAVTLALGTSLAGNVQSAALHTPFIDPTRTEIAFAGLPPLVAFVSIELVNHNPWANVPWGRYITWVLMGVVAPGSALVSFAHLTLVGLASQQVTVGDATMKWLNIATAVLTSLLVDGAILGGASALLLPPKPVVVAEPEVAEPVPVAVTQVPVQEEPKALPRTPKAQEEPKALPSPPAPRPKPVVTARLAPQTGSGPRRRWPYGEHPVFADWKQALESGRPWTPEEMVLAEKRVLSQEITVAAANTRINRWLAGLAK